jgi:biopolymer transport protein ExbD
MRVRRSRNQEADLDITSFMNLMIVLVPVLLMTMVFSQTAVLDLVLPDLGDNQSADNSENRILELVIQDDRMVLNYPAGVHFKSFPRDEGEYDFAGLSDVLQEVKRLLQEKGIDKKDILILSQPDTDYQTIVTAMDTVRSFKAVVAASVVDAELFPDISLGDALADEAKIGGNQ